MTVRVRFLSAVLAGAMAPGLAAPLVAQSLADVARKEEERRKAVKEPVKVYTNKDLKAVPSAPPEVPSDSAEVDTTKASAGATSQDAEKAAEKKTDEATTKDQAYWAGRMKELQTQLDRDGSYAEALQSRINALTADFAARDDPAQRSVIEQDRQKALSELDRLRKAVADGKTAIADLEEEARRAGVPPGWLR
jgi:DNA repair exonuclease SbcCD ATPase subunit